MNRRDQDFIMDIIAVCYEGEIFYRDSAQYAHSPDLHSAFHKMAAIKAEIINDLLPYATQDQDNQRRSNIMLIYGVQQSYKAIRSELSSGINERQVMVRVQVLEQCVLNLIRDALDGVKEASIHDLLELWYTASLTACSTIRNQSSLMAA